MTGEQQKLLTKMKKLIKEGQRKFLDRKDRSYSNDLYDIGITEDDAWNIILSLSPYDYCSDYRPFYYKSGDDALVFKKLINSNLVYIKITIRYYNTRETTVCISFHIDHN